MNTTLTNKILLLATYVNQFKLTILMVSFLKVALWPEKLSTKMRRESMSGQVRSMYMELTWPANTCIAIAFSLMPNFLFENIFLCKVEPTVRLKKKFFFLKKKKFLQWKFFNFHFTKKFFL